MLACLRTSKLNACYQRDVLIEYINVRWYHSRLWVTRGHCGGHNHEKDCGSLAKQSARAFCNFLAPKRIGMRLWTILSCRLKKRIADAQALCISGVIVCEIIECAKSV